MIDRNPGAEAGDDCLADDRPGDQRPGDQRQGDERLGKVLALASKVTRERFDQALRATGSSFHTYMVLSHARRYHGVSQRQLAEQLGIEGPTLVRHVDRLAEEGYVRRVRHERDRRVSLVELTPEGEAHLDRITATAETMDTELRRIFTEDELRMLYRLLHRIRDHYRDDPWVESAPRERPEPERPDREREAHVHQVG